MKFVLNATTGQLDLVGDSSGGGGNSTFTKSITNTDWVLNGDTYSVTVTAATHGAGVSPMVDTYFFDGTNYEKNDTVILVDTSGNVTVQVTSSPDNRFDGNIVII